MNPVLEYKCYILLREDLGMPQGKFSVQVGHGLDQVWETYNMYKESSRRVDNEDLIMPVANFENWKIEGRRKIVLKLRNEEHMNTVYEKMKTDILSYDEHPGVFVLPIFDYGFNFFNGLTQTGLIVYPSKEHFKVLKRLKCW